jgi:hypothetical protein
MHSLPPQNPIGFSPNDLIELAIAVFFFIFLIAGQYVIARFFAKLARRTAWCMVLLATLPVALRLALLAHHPVPTPDIYDEFSHLLVADTLRHFRLANPPHALPQFFETFFVLQRPTYSSIYPIGQGLALAVGWTLFGTPWAGVLLSTVAFCTLCYWMLRGWTTPSWALLGGLLAVFEFGPINQWTNDYWGGGYTAVAGCLVFGALPRLGERYSLRNALILGLGLAMHLLSRPFESIFLLISAVVFLRPSPRKLLIPLLVCIPALGIILIQNKQVTGNWLTLPYALSQYQYGVPASFTFQPHPTPHQPLTREQDLDYRMQRAFRAREFDTPATYFERLLYRVRYLRFFLYSPLYIAVLIFLIGIRTRRQLWMVLTLLLFAVGTNFYPLFLEHYAAALTCMFVLISVEGLRTLSRWPSGSPAARVLIYLCLGQFLLLYTVYAASTDHSGERRRQVGLQLAQIPGPLLVLVRYWPNHIFQDEWVYNAADIDASRTVWAHDLGDEEDKKLLAYYPNRRVLLLEPDARPPRLSDYHPQAPKPPEQPQPKPQKKDDKKTKPMILEQVR